MKKIGEVKEIQQELDHRTEVEAQASQLICEGRFEEAVEVLKTT